MAIDLAIDTVTRTQVFWCQLFLPWDAYWIQLLYCTTIFFCALLNLFLCLYLVSVQARTT